LAICVVLVENGKLRDSGARQVLDDLLRLVVVARPDVEEVAVEWRSQQLGARKRRDERHTRLGKDRERRLAGWRSDISKKQKDAVLFDQLLRILSGELRLVLVVTRA